MSTVLLDQTESTTATHTAAAPHQRPPAGWHQNRGLHAGVHGPVLHPASGRLRCRHHQGGTSRRRRHFPQFLPGPDGQDNPIFLSINRNKRSVSVDTRTDEGRAVLHRLMADADVVVSNFRSGVMERMGFGYEDLKAANPGIIWASGTGFGRKGPMPIKAAVTRSRKRIPE